MIYNDSIVGVRGYFLIHDYTFTSVAEVVLSHIMTFTSVAAVALSRINDSMRACIKTKIQIAVGPELSFPVIATSNELGSVVDNNLYNIAIPVTNSTGNDTGNDTVRYTNNRV